MKHESYVVLFPELKDELDLNELDNLEGSFDSTLKLDYSIIAKCNRDLNLNFSQDWFERIKKAKELRNSASDLLHVILETEHSKKIAKKHYLSRFARSIISDQRNILDVANNQIEKLHDDLIDHLHDLSSKYPTEEIISSLIKNPAPPFKFTPPEVKVTF